MTDLFKLTHVWAQHLGFKRMVVETMVIASETITSKAGWTKIATKEYARSCSDHPPSRSPAHPLTPIDSQPGLPRLSLKGASPLRQYHKCHALHTLSSLSTFCHWSLCPSRDTRPPAPPQHHTAIELYR